MQAFLPAPTAGAANVPRRMAATERHLRRRRDRSHRPANPAPKAQGSPAAAVPGAIVDFQDVTKVYDGGTVGLDRATFSVTPGEFLFLVGSTGSGKSTIMKLLTKELERRSG